MGSFKGQLDGIPLEHFREDIRNAGSIQALIDLPCPTDELSKVRSRCHCGGERPSLKASVVLQSMNLRSAAAHVMSDQSLLRVARVAHRKLQSFRSQVSPEMGLLYFMSKAAVLHGTRLQVRWRTVGPDMPCDHLRRGLLVLLQCYAQTSNSTKSREINHYRRMSRT